MHSTLDLIRPEELFEPTLKVFNPHNEHQDADEFFSLIIDQLNDNLRELCPPITKVSETVEAKGSEWNETGKAEAKVRNTGDELIKQSPVFEIFGGLMRNEIEVAKKRKASANVEPFFCWNLDITDEMTLESSIQ